MTGLIEAELIGTVIAFNYPRRNCEGEVVCMDRRRVEVTVEHTASNGRQVIRGNDLDRQAERYFWLDEMQDIEPVELLPESDEACCVVIIDKHGVSTVPRSVLPAESAETYVSEWNGRGHAHNSVAILKTRPLPRLTRDALGKVE